MNAWYWGTNTILAGKVYLLSDDDVLKPMEEAPYDSGLLLQEMLAKYPYLLAGEQINSDAPRRWLLVTREMSIPGDDCGNGHWTIFFWTRTLCRRSWK